MRPQTKSRFKLLVLVIVVVVILLAIFYQPFYRILNQIYHGLIKIPKLVVVMVTLLSLLGLGHWIGPQTLIDMIGLKEPKVTPETSIPDLTQILTTAIAPEKHKRNVSEPLKS